MVLGNFYFAFTYDSNSGCEPGEGALNVAIFCLAAGFLSLPLAVMYYVMWKKGRSTERSPSSNKKSEGEVSGGKTLLFFTFWNFVLAFVGFWMYCFQFDFSCKIEPIAIFILIYSMSQFVMVCTGCSACCYLTYSLAAGSKSDGADDVMGAGFAFSA